MKDEFYKALGDFLSSVGFKQDEDKWIRLGSASTPSQTFVINGQKMSQPGQKIDIQIIITIVGTILTGRADEPEDVWSGAELAHLNFMRKHNEEIVCNYDLGADYDSIEYFKQNIMALVNG